MLSCIIDLTDLRRHCLQAKGLLRRCRRSMYGRISCAWHCRCAGFGLCMSLFMSTLGEALALSQGAASAIGVIVGVIGMLFVVLAYPLYNRTVKKSRAKIAPEIIRWTDEWMKGSKRMLCVVGTKKEDRYCDKRTNTRLAAKAKGLLQKRCNPIRCVSYRAA